MSDSIAPRARWPLWAVLAVNAALFLAVLPANTLMRAGLPAMPERLDDLVPVAIAGAIAVALNLLAGPALKASLVFLRARYALPGHRAFTEYAMRDSRVNIPTLQRFYGGMLPFNPRHQIAAWEELHQAVWHHAGVAAARRGFLRGCDVTALSLFFLLVFGPWALQAMSNTTEAVVYTVLLVAQYLVARHLTDRAGRRMVTTVLALKTAELR